MSEGGYRVGVLGATGLVGTTILELLARARIPGRGDRAVASERSAGKAIEWGGEQLEVRALSEDSIQGLDIALFSAGGAVSAEWTPRLVEAGAVVVDNTSSWRMDDDVPLVVAEVNPDDARRPQGDRRQPELLDHADGRRAEAAPRRGRDRAPRDRHLPGGLRHRQGGVDELRDQSRAVLDDERSGRLGLPAPDRLQRAAAGRQLRRRRRPHRRGAQADQRDAQDPRRRRDPRQRDLRARARRHRSLRGGQRRDA